MFIEDVLKDVRNGKIAKRRSLPNFSIHYVMNAPAEFYIRDSDACYTGFVIVLDNEEYTGDFSNEMLTAEDWYIDD